MNHQWLRLDVSKETIVQRPVIIAQGDKSGTTIAATVYDNGTLLTETGLYVRFKMRLPDGRHFYSKGGTYSSSSGQVSVTIDETQAASVVGETHDAYFEFYTGSSYSPTVVYSTNRFTVRVLRSATDMATAADSYDDRVEEMLDEFGNLPTPSTETPLMDGTASYGSGNQYARGNHRHPTDTSRASAADLESHVGDTTAHVTAAERTAWNSKTSNVGTITGVTTNAPLSGSGTSGSVAISHANSGVTAASKGDTANQTPAFGGTFKVPSGTVNATGHLTAFADHTVTVPDAEASQSAHGLMSAADKKKLDGIEAGATADKGATSAPLMDGTAAVGTSAKYARENHVHPTDTSRLAASLKGAANGVAELDASGKVPSGQLPAATTVALGGVMPDGTSIIVDSDGTIHGAGEMTVSVTADGVAVSGVTVTVREGSSAGGVVAEYAYNGMPVTVRLPMGLDYHITASDGLRMYGPPVAVTGTVGVLSQSVTVEYSPLESVLVKEDGVYTNASLSEFWARQRDGKAYGIQMPTTSSTTCVKVGDNASVADPVPSTLAQVGSDPYATGRLGPYLHYDVNGYVDNDGTPHVTAIRGVDDEFALDGTNGNAWSMAPVLWELWEEATGSVTWTVSDTALDGYDAQPNAYLPSGTLRPYMLYAKYGGGMYGGEYSSVSGVALRNRDVSHDSMITITGSATTGYSGKSVADDWYLKMLWSTKYSDKDKQSYMVGCISDYNLQYHPTVAEAGVTRVIIAKTDAANLLVGSSMMLGSGSGTDRNTAANFDVFDGVRILRIEDYDASNSAVYMDTATTFDTATTQLLSTAPWYTGVTDGITYDGSPHDNASGKEPYVINGIETAYGAYEVLAGVMAYSASASVGYTPYVVADTRDDATSRTSDFVSCGAELPGNTGSSSAWRYPTHASEHGRLIYGTNTGGSTTTGLCDGHYVRPDSTTGTRALYSLGNMANARGAGPFCLYALGALSYASWSIVGRLSATGRAA